VNIAALHGDQKSTKLLNFLGVYVGRTPVVFCVWILALLQTADVISSTVW